MTDDQIMDLAQKHGLTGPERASKDDLIDFARDIEPSISHPDDIAVNRFAQQMKDKLSQARAIGRGGWQGLDADYLSRLLREHVDKGDPVDVANFCMFMADRGASIAPASPVSAAPIGWELAPHYRGYALLGVGAYLVNHTAIDAELGAEVVISIASEAQKAGRVVGDERDNEPGGLIQPEDMAVRIGFKNVAGLDVLENQLRYVRSVHFPDSIQADMVSVPRDLIGAACSAIDKKRDGPNVLAKLRRYTYGDLSGRHAPLSIRQIAEATSAFADVPSDKAIGIARAIEAAHAINPTPLPGTP